MKSNTESKRKILFTFGIFFTLLPMITINHNLVSSHEISKNNESLQISAVSGKLHIVGNSGWVDFRNAGNCSGSGTYSDPYVIEDMTIDAEGLSSGIWVENSTVYFKIKNVTVYNSGLTEGGIKLTNSHNGKLINNNCSSNSFGIFLSYSNNNTISNNLVNYNSHHGIYVGVSDYNTIMGNIAINNDQGLYIDQSNHNYITRNTANNNSDGIRLIISNNNNITQNQVFYNSQDGIFVGASNDNIIRGNIANNNNGGIFLGDNNNNTISENTINYNRWGIYLFQSYDNDVLGNIVYNNRDCGIFSFNGDNNIISGNSLHNNDYGVSLSLSNNNIFYFNNFINNTKNIFSDGSSLTWNSSEIMKYIYNGKIQMNYLGNYWDNYTGNDENNDGIGDTPFITGGIVDNHPLMEPIENYEIVEPSEVSGGEIPGYNLLFLFSILSFMVIIFIRKFCLSHRSFKRDILI